MAVPLLNSFDRSRDLVNEYFYLVKKMPSAARDPHPSCILLFRQNWQ
jgi:hypothetical protein